MASLFSARRKPKRITREDPGEPPDDGDEDTGPVVRRPQSNAPRTKSKLRVSFNPGGEEDYGSVSGTGASTPAAEGAATICQPVKKPSSRLGLAQDLISRRERHQDDQVLTTDTQSHDHARPKYNRAYLDELRNSTPSTPRDLQQAESPSASLDLITPSTNLELDLEAKFGKSALTTQSHIPSATEIREKKDRRARLAKEQAANAYSSTNTGSAGDDFISLEGYDSDGEFKPTRMQVGNYLAPIREKDTRLIHEDEDIAEGFDNFVEDTGRVTLSRKGLKEQSRQERESIRHLINSAEGAGSDDSNASNDEGGDESDSDLDRRRAYDLAQTHHGMDGLSSHHSHTTQISRPTQPRETTPIPKLSVSLTRLRDMLSTLEFERAKIVKRKADVEREKMEIKASQTHIQTSLEEAGRELERVRREYAERTASGSVNGAAPANGGTNGHVDGPSSAAERGLESFGGHA